MKLVEEAIIYATILHQGKVRGIKKMPFILHPLEVAQILSTMTDDQEVITAGILHDVVEGTDGTLPEIQRRFGDRVAGLVDTLTEKGGPEEETGEQWKTRKDQFLLRLKYSSDPALKMLFLADTLSNIRNLSREHGEMGENVWSHLHQTSPALQGWYYHLAAEYVEMDTNKTGAYKELIRHINDLWPGSFPSEKAKYRAYREVSVDGCPLIGRGAKGDVYRYDQECVVKVFNSNNTYADVEREIALSRRAFVLGIPTAISFGIVSVGKQYGAIYEMIDADTLATCITRRGNLDYCANVMADLALTIHGTQAEENDTFPDARERFRGYIAHGLALSDEQLADRCLKLMEKMPLTRHLVHGDFHAGNMFLLSTGDPLLIDLDRLSVGDPVFDLGDVYLYYMLPDRDENYIDPFLNLSCRVCRSYFSLFIKNYLKTEDKEKTDYVLDRAALVADIRLMNRYWKSGKLSEEKQKLADKCMRDIRERLERVNNLNILPGSGDTGMA